MRTWTATATATAAARPETVLHVLTDPDAASRWAPVPFDVEDDRRLAAGTRARVSGRLAGRRVGFEVDVHSADENGLALTATGPLQFDVAYRLAPNAAGSDIHATISLRPKRGIVGRLLAEATGALLNAGALETALARVATASACA